MLLYILLTIIAIGILLLSKPGRVILFVVLILGIICLALSILAFIGIYLFNVFVENKNEFIPVLKWLETVITAILGVAVLGGLIYFVGHKALYPLGYDKNRQIWTGKLKEKSNEQSKHS